MARLFIWFFSHLYEIRHPECRTAHKRFRVKHGMTKVHKHGTTEVRHPELDSGSHARIPNIRCHKRFRVKHGMTKVHKHEMTEARHPELQARHPELDSGSLLSISL